MTETLYILKNGVTEPTIGKAWLSNSDYVAAIEGSEESGSWYSGSALPFGGNEAILINEGAVRAVSKKFDFTDQFMGERYVTLNISSPKPIMWEKGDWCMVHGEKMTLRYVPTGKKQAREATHGEAFVYENVKFSSITGDLATRNMMDYNVMDDAVYYTGTGGFSFYVDKLQDLADRIQVNLDVHYPNQWLVEVKDGGEDFKKQKVSISDGTTILDALALANSTFNQNYYVETKPAGSDVMPDTQVANRLVGAGILTSKGAGVYTLTQPFNVITIGGSAEVMPSVLSYGKGRGLRNINVSTPSESAVVTRLRAFGASTNIPYRYYNQKYRRRRPNGEKMYEKFWNGDEYLLDSVNINTLMLPYEHWHKVSVNGKDMFNIYADAIKANFTAAGINVDAPTSLTEDQIFEYQTKFDSDDSDYDNCHPTLEEMTISNDWVGLYAYLSHYRSKRNLGYRPTVRNIIENLIEDLDYTYEVSWRYPDQQGQKNETLEKFLFLYFGDPDNKIFETAKKNISVKLMAKDIEFKKKLVDYNISSLSKDTDNLFTMGAYSSQYELSEDVFFDVTFSKDHTISYTIYEGQQYTNIKLFKGTWSFKVRVHYKNIGAKILEALNSGYAEPYGENGYSDWRYEETTQYMKELTSADINGIKNYTYQKGGRLDKVTSGSLGYRKSTGIEDNGIPDDENFANNTACYDTKDVLMVNEFDLVIPQVCFDMTDWQIDNEAKICMKTGMCAGREFTVASCIPNGDWEKGWRLTLGREYDTDLNMVFPNANFPIKEGDEYVITGISMPDIYVDAAEIKLFKNAMKYLSKVRGQGRTYTVELDNKWLTEHYEDYTQYLRSGKKFWFNDKDYDSANKKWIDKDNLGVGEVSIMIKQVVIRYGQNILPQYEITLDDDAESVSIQYAISNEVNAAKTDLSSAINDVDFKAKNALSKSKDDTAEGTITFNKGVVSKESSTFEKDVSVGELTVSGSIKAEGDIIPEENLKGGTSDGYIQIGEGSTGLRIKFSKGVAVSILTYSGQELLK